MIDTICLPDVSLTLFYTILLLLWFLVFRVSISNQHNCVVSYVLRRITCSGFTLKNTEFNWVKQFHVLFLYHTKHHYSNHSHAHKPSNESRGHVFLKAKNTSCFFFTVASFEMLVNSSITSLLMKNVYHFEIFYWNV